MVKKIELGDEVLDTVSGFKGVVVGITKWLSGCDRATVAPKVDKNGELVDAQTFDIPLLKVSKKAKVKEKSHTTGGFDIKVTQGKRVVK